ncbi:MAG: hypothetical protein C4523_01070 [Myxococcales bacterium]|nr:MAG: hypothetical protein C4523_01070 [Myxococcales bacterium]
MKIEPTQSIQNAYGVWEAKRVEKTREVSATAGVTIGQDTVTLSRGISAEEIQKALLTEIGQKVSLAMEAAGIDITAYAGMDMSPDAVATRIFNFTTSFFDLYKQKHADQSAEQQVDGFEKLVRDAVQEGYEEAMRILAAFDIDEQARSTAEATMTRLDEKYGEYFTRLREAQTQPVDAT